MNNGSFDPDGVISTLIQSPPGPYAKGATNVILTVTDDEGASSTCIATVSVIDNQPPAIVCPAAQIVEATGPSGAAASFSSPSVSDNCLGAIPVACTSTSGSTFPLGSTTVSCTATDASGNPNSCPFTVAVKDTTGPALAQPGNSVVEATSPAGAVVNYALPVVIDAVSTPIVTCTPSPGSTLPLGANTVTCTAEDAAGNVASTSFTITVQDTTPPIITIRNPDIDSVILSSPTTVTVQANDAVGVSSVVVNGVVASLIDGSPESGTWHASVPAPLHVSFGGQLSFQAASVDLFGNSAAVQLLVDNDGIAAMIDREPDRFTNDFSFGKTSGTIFRNERIVSVVPRFGQTVEVSASGPGGIPPAEIHTCPNGGSEVTRLDSSNRETVFIRCIDIGAGADATTEVTALEAQPYIHVYKINPYGACSQCYYYTYAYLSTGQTGRLGSPITASADNAEPFLVELQDSKNVPFGSFQLVPSGSVDVNFPSPATIELTVLSGTVSVTVEGQTTTLTSGQVQTQALPITVTKNLSGQISEYLASGDIKNGGIAQSLLASLNNANRLVKINNTAAKEILAALLNKLDAFSTGGQITLPLKTH